MVSPFGVYLSRVYAEAAVPDELLEAARVDGAGEFRTFFAMLLRIMEPASVTVSLIQFVAIWNNFFLPLVVLFFSLQGYWHAGATAGAIKG